MEVDRLQRGSVDRGLRLRQPPVHRHGLLFDLLGQPAAPDDALHVLESVVGCVGVWVCGCVGAPGGRPGERSRFCMSVLVECAWVCAAV